MTELTPLASILIIEDFLRQNYELDVYNSMKIKIAYLFANKKFNEFANNGFDELIPIMKYTADYLLNLVIIELKTFIEYTNNKVEKNSEQYIEYISIIDEILRSINSFIDNPLTINKVVNSNIIIERYINNNNLNTINMLSSALDMRVCEPNFSLIVNEFICNFASYNKSDIDVYEKMYKIAEGYNFFDKISYALISYTGTTTNDRNWDFKNIKENSKNKYLYNYNEPNFREVIKFIKIIDTYKNKEFFNKLLECRNLRANITHKPINPNENAKQYDEYKNLLNILVITYLTLSITAIEIDSK